MNFNIAYSNNSQILPSFLATGTGGSSSIYTSKSVGGKRRKKRKMTKRHASPRNKRTHKRR